MLVKCPRCELNYMKDTDKMCQVCQREVKGSAFKAGVDMCSECNERPALPGHELCDICLRDLNEDLLDEDEPLEDEAQPAPATGDSELDKDIREGKTLSLDEMIEKEQEDTDEDEDEDA